MLRITRSLLIVPSLLIALLISISSALYAEEVSLEHKGLTLNANLILAEESGFERIFLITHGTLAHNSMEIISSWQELLSDEGVSSLAINLSLGLDNRHGMYDCQTTHSHKHEDAAIEIEQWVYWLKSKGAKQIILAAHSRGGSQTVLYSNAVSVPEITAQILLAPQATEPEDIPTDYKKNYSIELTPLLEKAKQLPSDALLTDTDFIYCPKTSALAGSFVSYYQYSEGFNTPAMLKETKLPTLVFIGSEDTTVTGLEDKLSTIQNPLLYTSIIEGADHFFRDLYMDEVIEGTLAFLDAL